MLSIRIHGRGGHGVKTAGRIVGTAAFLAGYEAQDCPVYGAERRGAAIASYTRLDKGTILQRGVIDHPDLIIVGDETLLETSPAVVLAGQETASAVLVNRAESAGGDLERNEFRSTPITAPLVTVDITALTLEVLGKASALSAGLGAAAARLTGCLEEEHLLDAVHEELTHVGLSAELIERNVQVATTVFRAVPEVALRSAAEHHREPIAAIHRVVYDNPLRGTPSIVAAGNAMGRPTGTWRVERPEIDREHCTRCGICFVRCPDGAIALDEQGYPVIDYDHCKGCMICWQQCPVTGAMDKKKEVRAW